MLDSLSDDVAAARVRLLELHGYAAVVRAKTAEHTSRAIEAYISGGLKVIEITTTCPNWREAIKELSRREDILVGAGTILTMEQARDAVASGAKFVVSPILDEEVVAEVNGPLRSVMIPGCATPSECWRAHKLGCRFQKVFG